MSGVFAVGGVWATALDAHEGGWVDVREAGTERIQIRLQVGSSSDRHVMLEVNQARWLARELYRLARRVEKRTGVKE